jgi:putative MATE family efflux protein
VAFLFIIKRGHAGIGITWRDLAPDLRRIWQIARIALPAGVEMVVLQAGLLIYAKFIVGYGTVALSGYQVGMQVLSLSFIPNTGFGTAASTLVGQNLGADRKETAKRTGWICMFWGMLSMGLLGVMYLIFTRPLASIFVDDAAVIDVAISFIRAVAICQAGMAVFFTLSGALRGAGDTRSPLLITLLGMYGIRIPGAFMVTQVWELGVGVAFGLLILDYMVRDGAILVRWARGRWVHTRI